MVVYPLSILALGGAAFMGRESRLVLGILSLIVMAVLAAILVEASAMILDYIRDKAGETVAKGLLGGHWSP